LRDEYRALLPDGESVVFEALEMVYPDGLTYEQLATGTTYARRSLTDYTGRLKTRGIITKHGSAFVLSANLYDAKESP
jgi:hypothetical protein